MSKAGRLWLAGVLLCLAVWPWATLKSLLFTGAMLGALLLIGSVLKQWGEEHERKHAAAPKSPPPNGQRISSTMPALVVEFTPPPEPGDAPDPQPLTQPSTSRPLAEWEPEQRAKFVGLIARMLWRKGWREQRIEKRKRKPDPH